jgi:hypothetical protein
MKLEHNYWSCQNRLFIPVFIFEPHLSGFLSERYMRNLEVHWENLRSREEKHFTTVNLYLCTLTRSWNVNSKNCNNSARAFTKSNFILLILFSYFLVVNYIHANSSLLALCIKYKCLVAHTSHATSINVYHWNEVPVCLHEQAKLLKPEGLYPPHSPLYSGGRLQCIHLREFRHLCTTHYVCLRSPT